jgi:hypothetical protein
MPTFSSASNIQLRYITESTPGTIPGAGNAVNLRQTSPTLKATIGQTKSNEMRSDRLATGSARTSLDLDGGFNFELSGKEYDPFFESTISSTFAHYGTAGLGTSFTATTLAGSITAAVAPTTTSAFTNLAMGSWIKVIPPSGASQAVKDYFADRFFKIHASTPPTSTVITLDASTPIAAPGIVTSIAGYAISQSLITNASTKKYFSMEYQIADVTEFMTFTGMRVNNLSLNLEVGSLITGTFDFMGLGHTSQQTTLLPGSPVASQTLDPMSAVTDVGTLYEAGSSLLTNGCFIKSLKLTVGNNLRAQKAIATFGNTGIGEGELALGGQMEVYFPDATYYRKWLSGTNTDLAIGMADAAGNGYLFELPKVTFKDGALNPGGRNDDVMLTLPFDAFYGPTLTKGIRITRSVAA